MKKADGTIDNDNYGCWGWGPKGKDKGYTETEAAQMCSDSETCVAYNSNANGYQFICTKKGGICEFGCSPKMFKSPNELAGSEKLVETTGPCMVKESKSRKCKEEATHVAAKVMREIQESCPDRTFDAENICETAGEWCSESKKCVDCSKCYDIDEHNSGNQGICPECYDKQGQKRFESEGATTTQSKLAMSTNFCNRGDGYCRMKNYDGTIDDENYGCWGWGPRGKSEYPESEASQICLNSKSCVAYNKNDDAWQFFCSQRGEPCEHDCSPKMFESASELAGSGKMIDSTGPCMVKESKSFSCKEETLHLKCVDECPEGMTFCEKERSWSTDNQGKDYCDWDEDCCGTDDYCENPSTGEIMRNGCIRIMCDPIDGEDAGGQVRQVSQPITAGHEQGSGSEPIVASNEKGTGSQIIVAGNEKGSGSNFYDFITL